jgi:teichuronic acid biosynthesis glycosyltransferase TuaG
MSPTVSVIIPTWNAAATVKTAVLSALKQTHPPLEVLVCDDGSSDNTKEIVASIIDPRVRWLPGGRGGTPAIPRNRGIRASQGEWLAILDSDDEWLPEKLEKQLQLAQQLGCKAASTNSKRLLPEKGVAGNILEWQKERITFADLIMVNQVVCSSAIFHRSLLPFIIGFPEAFEIRSFADWATWLRISTRTDFAYVDEPLMIYWDDPSSSLRKHDPDVWSQRKIVFDNFLAWAAKQKRSDKSLRLPIAKLKQQRRVDLRQSPNDSKPEWRESWRERKNSLRIVGGKVKRLFFK